MLSDLVGGVAIIRPAHLTKLFQATHLFLSATPFGLSIFDHCSISEPLPAHAISSLSHLIHSPHSCSFLLERSKAGREEPLTRPGPVIIGAKEKGKEKGMESLEAKDASKRRRASIVEVSGLGLVIRQPS